MKHIKKQMKRLKSGVKHRFFKRALTGLFCLLVSATATAQQQRINGVVTDAGTQETLVGVTVFIKGTTTGTSTDAGGRFSISTVEGNVLQFSYVGYKTYEYTVPERAEALLRIVLEEDAAQIGEVVIEAGLFQRERFGFTGAFTAIGQAELKAVGNINVLQSLKTIDPSFVIVENNLMGSNPNVMASIELRGQTTMDINTVQDEAAISTNLPLFILDGFETTLQVINDLDINRVESITLLKDAGSTAIYGSKGANGVIVIETIKPKPGEVQIIYTGAYQVAVPDLSVYNMMNAAEKLEYERLAGRWNYAINPVEVPEIVSPDRDYVSPQERYFERLAWVRSGVDSYWLSDPVRAAFTQSHSLTVSGGRGLQYLVGLNYRANPGVMKGSERNTYGGNVKLIYRGERGFSINNDITVMDVMAKSGSWGSFSNFVNANPYFLKRNEDGSIPKYLDRREVGAGTAYRSESAVNPLYNAMLNSRNDDHTFIVTNNTSIEWKTSIGLMLKGGLGLTRQTGDHEIYTSPSHSKFDNRDHTESGEYSSRHYITTRYNANLSANYAYSVGKNNFTLIARTHIQESNAVSKTFSVVGFNEASVGYPSQGLQYPAGSRPAYSQAMRRSVGFIAAFNYNYEYRYLLDLNYNTEGSSSFGRNRRFQSFWSVGAGWNVDREAFAQNWTWLRELKLRATYGMNGNDNVNVVTQSVYSYFTGNNVFGQSVYRSQFGNPDLKWQVVEKKSAGVDVVVLGGNLRINFDVYENYTDPLVVQLDQRASTGIGSYPVNMGFLRTRGYEFRTTYNVINRPSDRLLVSVLLTGAHNRSVYGGFSDALNALNDAYRNEDYGNNPRGANQSLQSLQRYVDGNSPQDLWAVRSLGIDPASGREIFLKLDGTQTFSYDSRDRVVIANSRPDIQGIFGVNVRYRQLTANFNMRYYLGAHQYNSALFNKVENITRTDIVYNQDRRALYDRWKAVGDVAQFKDIASSDTNVTPVSSRFIQKDNYLRGESAMIRWSFTGDNWLQAIKVKDLSVGVSMQDIFTISSIQIERGIDYPFQRSMQMNVSVRF